MALLWNVFRTINPPLPAFKTLDEGIDYLMDYVGIYSEDLSNREMYVGRRWIEVRDNVHFQESLLHIFEDGGTYIRILDGDISSGSWSLGLGGFVYKYGGSNELYELVFLNEDFFILRKHGKKTGKKDPGYLVFVREGLAQNREWTHLLEHMYELYKGNSNYVTILFILAFLIAVVLFFSLR